MTQPMKMFRSMVHVHCSQDKSCKKMRLGRSKWENLPISPSWTKDIRSVSAEDIKSTHDNGNLVQGQVEIFEDSGRHRSNMSGYGLRDTSQIQVW